MRVLEGHRHNSVLEIKLLVQLVDAVIDRDLVVLIKSTIDIGGVEVSIDDIAEENLSVATSSCDDGSVFGPVKLHD